MRSASFTLSSSRAMRVMQGFFFLLCLACLLCAATAHAMPAAGTAIGNQASATYTDDSATVHTVTSNTVVTIVQQVASLTLNANGAKNAAPGAQVTYPHTIVNTGNGPDSFNLSSSNTGGFSFPSVVFYADVNGDGIPDNATPITNTGAIPAGGVFKFVAAATVPGGAAAASTNAITLTANSAFTPAVTASNVDTTTVSSQAVVNVTKSMDLIVGASPSTGRTVTLTYTNSGAVAATNVTLMDTLPSGMTYVANSARWSVTGATVLTDADSSDNQSGIVYNFGVTQAGRVTAVIGSVGAFVSGTLTFQVNINAGLPAGGNSATANTARFSYNDGTGTIGPINTNTVQFSVAQGASLTLSGSTVASVSQSGTASFTQVLTNTGNGTDSFDISLPSNNFPAGTTFTLFKADGLTPMVDSNGNGVLDTGPIAAGASQTFILKAQLPSGATGGPFNVQVTGTSKTDATKNASATDTLTSITSSTVDITANSTGGSAPGYGPGPEVSAVVNNTVSPGNTTRFTLYVANGSTGADTFNLQASTDSSFASAVLPAGWSVVFKDAGQAVLSNSGLINGGTNKVIYADVTVPAGANAGTTEVYFRAVSPTSGASDRIHEAVTVGTIRSLTLTPNHTGQIFAGGAAVYPHTLTNTGNVLEGDGTVSIATVSATDTVGGFSSVVYWDKNNNGILDTSDPVLTNLSQLTGGSNGASTAAGLSPGESAMVFVRVFAPAGATAGALDTTTISISVSGLVNGAAAPAAATATDNSTVNSGQIVLRKLQALDANCDGIADTAFDSATLTTGVIPGACIRYEITATNIGTSNTLTVVVNDATPVQTTYHATVAAATTVGSLTTPSAGVAGSLQATIGTLTPGQSAVVTFGVRIDP